MSTLSEVLYHLNLGQRRVIYTSQNGDEITAERTNNYGPRDFVIRIEKVNGPKIQIPQTRLFSDLDKKLASDKQKAKVLFCIIEEINNKKDPKNFIQTLSGLTFSNQTDDADVNVYCAQLMMIEQDFNYGPGGYRKSRFKPPREFFMHYIRWVYSQDNDIKYINVRAVGKCIPPSSYNQPITCEDI